MNEDFCWILRVSTSSSFYICFRSLLINTRLVFISHFVSVSLRKVIGDLEYQCSFVRVYLFFFLHFWLFVLSFWFSYIAFLHFWLFVLKLLVFVGWFVTTVINNELVKIKDCSTANKLSLNVEKIKYSFFYEPIKKDVISLLQPKLVISNYETQREESISLLRVLSDQRSSWKFHKKLTESKIAKSICTLYKANLI